MKALIPQHEGVEREVNGDKGGVRLLRADECLEEVSKGIGSAWKGRPLYGASRSGLTPAKEAIGKHPERYKPVEPGTVFYNPMRILLGSIAMLDDGEESGITSPDYVVVRGRPGVLHHRIFYYWLRSIAGQQLILDLARGGVRERILFKRLCEGEIPILHWGVQVRIAEQLAILPRVRAAAQARLAAAESLPAAYLRECFGQYEPGGWESVDHVCLTIDYGHTASAKATRDGPRFLRITDIQDGRVDWATVPGCEIDPADENSLGLADGDIVFARTGATTGKSLLIRNPPRAVFASYLIRLRVDPAIALADFVYLYFQSSAYWDQLRAFARGAAQPNVNATLLGQIKLPLPPLDQQHRFLAGVLPRLAAAEHLAKKIRCELAAIESLPGALLRSAFQLEGNDAPAK